MCKSIVNKIVPVGEWSGLKIVLFRFRFILIKARNHDDCRINEGGSSYDLEPPVGAQMKIKWLNTRLLGDTGSKWHCA